MSSSVPKIFCAACLLFFAVVAIPQKVFAQVTNNSGSSGFSADGLPVPGGDGGSGSPINVSNSVPIITGPTAFGGISDGGNGGTGGGGTAILVGFGFDGGNGGS